MKRKLRLKNWVKELLIFALFFSIVLVTLFIYADRNEKIESRELVEISKEYMK